MRIRILHGSEAGQVQEQPNPWAEVAVQTGYAELYAEPPMAKSVDKAAREVPVIELLDRALSHMNELSEPAEEDEAVDLASLTVAELEDVGDDYGIEAVDIEGTGVRGRVVRADWLRVLAAHG